MSPSYHHAYLNSNLIAALHRLKNYSVFSELTLQIESKDYIPDVCLYLKKPMNFASGDILRMTEMPLLAIEVINGDLFTEIKPIQPVDLLNALPQCAAEMYAARLFNQQRDNPLPIIYGVITSGYDWLFLKFDENKLFVDQKRYFLNDLPELLGCWQKLIDNI